MVMDNDSLGGREPENDTDNFPHCLLSRAALNLMMKCDQVSYTALVNTFSLHSIMKLVGPIWTDSTADLSNELPKHMYKES